MRSFFIHIKKFFSILLSFLLGIFFKEKESFDSSSNVEKNDLEKLDSKPKNKSHPFDNSLESNGFKSRNSTLYLRQDFERLYYIVQKISKIESQLKLEIDESNLEEIKRDLDSINQELQFLEKKYGRAGSKQKEVEELTIQLESTKVLVDKIEKKVKSVVRVSSTTNLDHEEDTQKIEVENQHLEEPIITKKDERKTCKMPVFKKSKPNLDHNTKSEKVVRSSKQSSDHSFHEQSVNQDKEIESTILSSIIIKDHLDDLIEDRVESEEYICHETLKEDRKVITNQEKEENTLVNNPIKKEDKKQKNSMKIKISSQAKIRKYSIPLKSLKSKISRLKFHHNIQRISFSVKEAFRLTGNISMLIISKRSSPEILASSLLRNRHIRKARAVHNRKMKPLNYHKMLKTVFYHTSIDDQIDYVMMDTMSQIEQLRAEIYANYELTEEVQQILNELDMIEVEIKNNVSQKNQNSENQRTR